MRRANDIVAWAADIRTSLTDRHHCDKKYSCVHRCHRCSWQYRCTADRVACNNHRTRTRALDNVLQNDDDHEIMCVSVCARVSVCECVCV